MKKYIDILSNFLNKLLVNANEPKTVRQLLLAFGLPTTIIFGSEFAQDPKLISFNFLLLLIGIGMDISALSLNKSISK